MKIQFLGNSALRVKTKSANIVMSPYPKSIGGKKMKLSEADVVLVPQNKDAYNSLESIKGEPYVINSAGEYEVKEHMFLGKDVGETVPSIIYRFSAPGINVAYLGLLDRKLDEAELDFLGKVDIAIVSTGGINGASAKVASEIVNQIEPAVVVPMNYKSDDGMSHAEEQEEVAKFVEALGTVAESPADTLTVKASDFDGEEVGTRVVILNRI